MSRKSVKRMRRSSRLGNLEKRSVAGAGIQGGFVLRSDLFWSGVIFSVAFVTRLIYLFQIQSIPLFYNLPGDAREYHAWGHARQRPTNDFGRKARQYVRIEDCTGGLSCRDASFLREG